MDREFYKSLSEAYQSIYEAPGAGALLQGAGRVVTNPQVIKQGGKVGGSLALQKLQNWPEYREYRDQGYSEEDAAKRVASRLGLNVTGSILGSSLGSTVGPAGSVAGGVAGGPALVALVDALENEKTQKQKQYESGVVWDDKSGKYVVKADNLTQDDLESDEAFAERKKAGEAMAKELNSAKGGPKPPTWLEYERGREKERAQAARAAADGPGASGTRGPSETRTTPGTKTYTVSGIEYDRATGRPVNPPPAFVPGQSRNPPTGTETETETDTREISGTDRDGNPIYTSDVEQRNIESGATVEREVSGYDKDGNPIYTSDVEQRNIESGATSAPTGGNAEPAAPKGPTNRDGSNVTQKGKNDAGLTPYQQWAKNFPKLAAKVKPGQAGYDDIQAMNKAKPTAVTDPQPDAEGRTRVQKVGDAVKKTGNALLDRTNDLMNSQRTRAAGRAAQNATVRAAGATRRAAGRVAGTVADQTKKGLGKLNNAVRNRTGNNNNE